MDKSLSVMDKNIKAGDVFIKFKKRESKKMYSESNSRKIFPHLTRLTNHALHPNHYQASMGLDDKGNRVKRECTLRKCTQTSWGLRSLIKLDNYAIKKHRV